MAKITPPTFTDGTVTVASDLYDTFYAVNGDSYEVINGRLSADNMALVKDDTKIGYNYIQRGALTGGDGVAGTANLDYFSGLRTKTPEGSGHYANVGFPPSNPKRYMPIPGASVRFYLPFDAYVLLTWSITWTNDCFRDGQQPEQLTDIALFINGSTASGGALATDPYARCVGQTFLGPPSGDQDLQDRYKSRTYSGHCLIDGRKIPALGPGYHSASLRISQHQLIKQSRVRARSMQYIYFKYGDS